MVKQTEKENRIEVLAAQVMQLARDAIIMHLRFLDVAVAQLRTRPDRSAGTIACDGSYLYYAPVYVLRCYQKEPNSITRMYLHVLLHCIFCHNFQYDKVESKYWDMAADMAVENTILELSLRETGLRQDEAARQRLHQLGAAAGGLTAERIYKYFKKNNIDAEEEKKLRTLFCRDEHLYWKQTEKSEITEAQWKKLSERVRTDLKTFSRDQNHAEELEKNLLEAARERYDYKEVLRKFTVMGEEIRINEDEFDYIYYTYGMSSYGNLPLIEPLEYKESHKIKEFVIAIDTSASCRGEAVRRFLRQTYSILKGTENFFHKVNVHILQCDNEIQQDTRITSEAELDCFLSEGRLRGFGATDFRPVFTYVEQLKQQGEFENLKGLIYFTDGYGSYPEKMPEYDVIFAFLEEDDNRQPSPPWALGITLYEDMLEEEIQ